MISIDSIRPKESLVQYVYTLGVMVSAVALSDQFGGFDSVLLWLASLAAALGWVAYYRFAIVPRFKQFSEGE